MKMIPEIIIESRRPKVTMRDLKNYQEIPKSVLSSMIINTDLEQRAIQEYDKLVEYNARLAKEREIRRNRKAPGYKDGILVPAKDNGVGLLRDEKSSTKVDYSEFDGLSLDDGITHSSNDSKNLIDSLLSNPVSNDYHVPLNSKSNHFMDAHGNGLGSSNTLPQPTRFVGNMTPQIPPKPPKTTLIDNVRDIVSMGFTEEEASMALISHGNDKQSAIEHLLNQST